MNRRVVVTGVGVVSPLGMNAEATWANAIAGKSGITQISRFDVSRHSSRIGGTITGLSPEKYMPARLASVADPFLHYCAAAGSMALEDAGIGPHDKFTGDMGVCMGSSAGGQSIFEEQQKSFLLEGPARVSALTVPLGIVDMGGGFISIKFGLLGPNHCVVSACASGASAIGESFEMIRAGRIDRMLAGGADAITPLYLAAFGAAKALSLRNNSPEKASRPFDAGRDGFVMGEGGAALVLEDLASAIARNAKIYGEIIGYGTTADAHHLTAPRPDGAGAQRAMVNALRQANVGVDDVGYINAHATGTPLGDELEVIALRKVFGAHINEIPVSSTKSMTGHMLGAAGAVEAAFCLFAMRDGILPPTVNNEQLDKNCQIDVVPNKAREQDVAISLSNSFGFGGHNVSLVFKRM